MSDIDQVVRDAQKFAAQFAGFIKAAEAFAGVASIEQAEAEALTRLAVARQAIDQASLEGDRVVADAQHRAEELVAAGEASRLATMAEAEAIARAASQAADQLKAGAATDIAGHRAAAAAELAAIGDQIAAAKLELDGLAEQLAARRASLDELNSAFAETQGHHESIKGELAALRAKL